MSRSVAIIGSLASSLRNFRGALIEDLLAAGHEVHAFAPDLRADKATADWLTERNVRIWDVPFRRAGLNPLSDLTATVALCRLLRAVRPDAMLVYTIKPVIWGMIAGRLASVPRRVALITGLGYTFAAPTGGGRALLRRIALALYRFALRYADVVLFQNPDDRQDFQAEGLLPGDTPTAVINGSGVRLDAFAPQPFPPPPVNFLMIARLLGEKGVREYAAAARRLRAEGLAVRCTLVGGLASQLDAIRAEEVRGWQTDGDIVWLGELADVRPAIAAAHVYVLPSYREGTPRSVLEAMAMGRPIITTDAPGCRETVECGVNGVLVPPRDVPALARAMANLAGDLARIERMGAASREAAERKYDVHNVNREIIAALSPATEPGSVAHG